MSVLSSLQNTIPAIYRPETNTVILALLTAIANADEDLITQAVNAKEQLFVRTATGQGLERIGKALGVFRPANLSITDTVFQELIPNLSLKPKQIKKAFYDTAEVFWGARISRANATTLNTPTFNLNLGDVFKIAVDNGVTQTLKIESGDVTGGAATAAQVKIWLSKLKNVTVEIIIDPLTSLENINISTNTPGSQGGLEFFTSTAIGTGKLEFSIGKVDVLDLEQRFVVYNVNPNELLIEIPTTVPGVSSTLRGTHHFHSTATIESNLNWKGSFLFDPSGTGGNFSISAQNSTLTTAIAVGDALTTIDVASTTGFTDKSGDLIFDFGRATQEFPVPYVAILNSTTIAIDPNFTFKKTHDIGKNVNVMSSRAALLPNKLGTDLAVYLPSMVAARLVVQKILEKLRAAGIVLKFVTLVPRYKYIIDSPYEE